MYNLFIFNINAYKLGKYKCICNDTLIILNCGIQIEDGGENPLKNTRTFKTKQSIASQLLNI